MLAAVRGQAHHLRDPDLARDRMLVPRQICQQAMELGEGELAAMLRKWLLSCAEPGLVPQWTTRRASSALLFQLGAHDSPIGAVAVLPGGRIITAGRGGRVLLWDPANPTGEPRELATSDSVVTAVAVLPDGRIVVVDHSVDDIVNDEGWVQLCEAGRVLIWDPTNPSAEPYQLAIHGDQVQAVAALPDRRVATGGRDGRVVIWDVQTGRSLGRLRCSAAILATSITPSRTGVLVVAHLEGGLSTWTL